MLQFNRSHTKSHDLRPFRKICNCELKYNAIKQIHPFSLELWYGMYNYNKIYTNSPVPFLDAPEDKLTDMESP